MQRGKQQRNRMKKLFLLFMFISLYAKGWYVSVSGGSGESNHEISTYSVDGSSESVNKSTKLSYVLYKVGYITDNNNNFEICVGDEIFFNHIFIWQKDKFSFDVGYGVGFYKIDSDNNAFGGKILTGIEYEVYKDWSVLGFLNYLTGINGGINSSEFDRSYLFEIGIKYQLK